MGGVLDLAGRRGHRGRRARRGRRVCCGRRAGRGRRARRGSRARRWRRDSPRAVVVEREVGAEVDVDVGIVVGVAVVVAIGTALDPVADEDMAVVMVVREHVGARAVHELRCDGGSDGERSVRFVVRFVDRAGDGRVALVSDEPGR